MCTRPAQGEEAAALDIKDIVERLLKSRESVSLDLDVADVTSATQARTLKIDGETNVRRLTKPRRKARSGKLCVVRCENESGTRRRISYRRNIKRHVERRVVNDGRRDARSCEGEDRSCESILCTVIDEVTSEESSSMTIETKGEGAKRSDVGGEKLETAVTLNRRERVHGL